MPELPEVETVRRGIESHVVGRRITRVEVGRERTVRRTSREALIDGLSGTTVVPDKPSINASRLVRRTVRSRPTSTRVMRLPTT